jgi:hypothetical protein
MSVTKPVSVPKKDITSIDITGFSGGLNLLEGATGNQIVGGVNVEATPDGFLVPTKSQQKWLPDTVGVSYQKFPAFFGTDITYYTADNGKIKWCKEADSSWTDCGGSNSVTTGVGIKTTFLRVLDVLLVMNGTDKLCYVDLATKNVVKWTAIADPTTALTAVLTGAALTGTTYKIYYGYTFSSATGETKLNTILTQSIGKTRDQWAPATEYITLTRPAGIPVGAKCWNLYIALASNGGTIQTTDMMALATGIDMNTVSVVDDGTLSIDIGRGNPPSDNSTDGPIVTHGLEASGRPVLFGDIVNPENVWIGGDGEYALDFSPSHGGFRSTPSKGTNFYPTSVIGFRNGQGIPSLTILFSNTEGISKQATLEQQTITYGNQSAVVWSVTEQNYGAAGVASSYGVINYKGALSFPSTDGFMSMITKPTLQNVLTTVDIDKNIKDYVQRINVGALPEIVGTAWGNKLFWIVPANGFTTPNEILICDQNLNGAWFNVAVPAQWIGTVSPLSSPAFVYICQGNQTLKLAESFGTVNFKGAGATTFPTGATGAWIGINDARNAFKAVVQTMFDFRNLIGDVTIGVNYRNENGKVKTKQKLFHGPQYVQSASGGWSDPQYVYDSNLATPATWSAIAQIDATATAVTGINKRIPLRMDVLASELQLWYETPDGFCNYLFRGVSYEGVNLGIKPDLR